MGVVIAPPTITRKRNETGEGTEEGSGPVATNEGDVPVPVVGIDGGGVEGGGPLGLGPGPVPLITIGGVATDTTQINPLSLLFRR